MFRYEDEEAEDEGAASGGAAEGEAGSEAKGGEEEKEEGGRDEEEDDEKDPLLGTPTVLQWAGPRPEGRAFCLAWAQWSTSDRPPRAEGPEVPPRLVTGSDDATQEPALVPGALRRAAGPLYARLAPGRGARGASLQVAAAAGTAPARERVWARALEAAALEAGTQRVVEQLRRLRRGAYDRLIGRVKEAVIRSADVEEEYARTEQESGQAGMGTTVAARPSLASRLWLRVRRGPHRGEVPPGGDNREEWRCVPRIPCCHHAPD